MRIIFQSAVLSGDSNSVHDIIEFAKNSLFKSFFSSYLINLWSVEILNKENYDVISSRINIYRLFEEIIRTRYTYRDGLPDACYSAKRLFNASWILDFSPEDTTSMMEIISEKFIENLWTSALMVNAFLGFIIERSTSIDAELARCISKLDTVTNSMVVRLAKVGIKMDRDVIKRNPDLIVSMESYYTSKEKLEFLGLTMNSKGLTISSNSENPWFTKYASIWNEKGESSILNKREYLSWVAKEITNNRLV